MNEHKHTEQGHDHVSLFRHGVLSVLEHKAIKELSEKIGEAKCFDFNRFTLELNDAERAMLYDEYLQCCHCGNTYSNILEAIVPKNYELARPLIMANANDLPECVKLLAIHDALA